MGIKRNIASIFTLIVAGAFCFYSLSKECLKPEDFNKAPWIEYDNKDGILWDNYMGEKIPRNISNWELYQTEVKKKNDGNLEGEILLPDLDKDGRIRSR